MEHIVNGIYSSQIESQYLLMKKHLDNFKLNYNFIKKEFNIEGDGSHLTPVWSKAVIEKVRYCLDILNKMKDNEIAFFTDVDIMPLNTYEFLIDFLKDNDIVFMTDKENNFFHKQQVNSGFYLVKKTKKSINLIKKWLDECEKEEKKGINVKNQPILNRILLDFDIKYDVFPLNIIAKYPNKIYKETIAYHAIYCKGNQEKINNMKLALDNYNKLFTKRNLKVALAFWGLGQLDYSYQSLEKNILNILKFNKIDYDMFWYTYKVDKFKNFKYNNYQNNILKAKYYKIEEVNKVKEFVKLENYRYNGDIWNYNDNFKTLDNFILAMYSKYKTTMMIKESLIEYDYIIFLRPDVIYKSEFKLEYFDLVNDRNIVIPDFAKIGKFRFNDRFAILNYNNYLKYGTIFDKLLKLGNNFKYHSEYIIGYILREIYDLNFEYIYFYFSRVRGNGKIIYDKSETRSRIRKFFYIIPIYIKVIILIFFYYLFNYLFFN